MRDTILHASTENYFTVFAVVDLTKRSYQPVDSLLILQVKAAIYSFLQVKSRNARVCNFAWDSSLNLSTTSSRSNENKSFTRANWIISNVVPRRERFLVLL
jgi:hypothetical protein